MRRILQTALVLMLISQAAFSLAQETPTAPAQTPPENPGIWMARAAQAYRDEDFEAWSQALEALRQLRPHNADFMHQLVTAYALQDKKSEAFNVMLLMQRQGMAFDWDTNPNLDNLRDTGLYNHLNTLMKEANQHFGEGQVAFSLDGRNAMPEALAHDPGTTRWFAGTLRDGLILSSSDGGQSWQRFAVAAQTDGLNAVLGLAVDAQRRHLWVSTSMVPQFRRFRPGNFGRSALLKFNIDSGELEGEYRVRADGQPHVLGALAVTGDGTVYAADSESPRIYRLKPGDERPEPLIGNPIFTSLRGIALSDDDTMLYFADYELGLFAANLENEQAWRVAVPEDLNVGGVDGLFWFDDDLVIIQNNFSPQRVMRLKLGPDGLGVVAVQPLESNHPAFDHPTYGAIAGDRLYYIAASHWRHVDENGHPHGGARLPAVPIVATDLNSDVVVATGQTILDQIMGNDNDEDESP